MENTTPITTAPAANTLEEAEKTYYGTWRVSAENPCAITYRPTLWQPFRGEYAGDEVVLFIAQTPEEAATAVSAHNARRVAENRRFAQERADRFRWRTADSDVYIDRRLITTAAEQVKRVCDEDAYEGDQAYPEEVYRVAVLQWIEREIEDKLRYAEDYMAELEEHINDAQREHANAEKYPAFRCPDCDAQMKHSTGDLYTCAGCRMETTYARLNFKREHTNGEG